MGDVKRRTAAFAAVAVLAFSALTGCGTEIDNGAMVVTIGEDKVTMDVANFFARHQQAIAQMQYGSMLGEDFWGMSLSEDGKTMEEDVKENILTTLEQMYVLEDHMGDYGVELTKDEKAKIQEAAKKFVEANSEEALEKVSGSEETVSRVLELVTIQEKMRQAMIADVDTNVSDEDAAQKSMQYVFFSFTETDAEGKSKTMSDKEKKELKAKAEAFAAAAAKADDFEALAKEQGQTANTLTFDGEKKNPSEEFIKAADALKEGEVTKVIENENGYYVGKLTSLFDKEATEQEKATIVSERQNKKYQEVLDGFMKKADIKVNEKEWKKVSFEKLDVTMKQPQEEKPEQ